MGRSGAYKKRGHRVNRRRIHRHPFRRRFAPARAALSPPSPRNDSCRKRWLGAWLMRGGSARLPSSILPRFHAATYSRHGAPGPWPWPCGVGWWRWCRPSRRRADTATCNGRHELGGTSVGPDTHVRRKGHANSRALTRTHLAKVGAILCACHEQLTAAQFCEGAHICRVHASFKVALGADEHLKALHVCTLCQRRRNINVHRHTTNAPARQRSHWRAATAQHTQTTPGLRRQKRESPPEQPRKHTRVRVLASANVAHVCACVRASRASTSCATSALTRQCGRW